MSLLIYTKYLKEVLLFYIHKENDAIKYIKLQRNGRYINGKLHGQKIYSAFKPSRYYVFVKK